MYKNIMTENIAEILSQYRKNIDSLDDEIVSLLALRLQVIHKVAQVKHENNIAPHLQDRVDEVLERNSTMADALGADSALVHTLYQHIIQHAIDTETALIADMKK
jgi:chorismate mutase